MFLGTSGGRAVSPAKQTALHRLGLVSSYSAEPSGLLLPQTRRAKCQQGSSKKRRDRPFVGRANWRGLPIEVIRRHSADRRDRQLVVACVDRGMIPSARSVPTRSANCADSSLSLDDARSVKSTQCDFWRVARRGFNFTPPNRPCADRRACGRGLPAASTARPC
jgi:hypothetical protein